MVSHAARTRGLSRHPRSIRGMGAPIKTKSTQMPRISEQKTEKISEQILFHLYSTFPRQLFTSDIAKETARDEEFTKKLLEKLERKKLVVKIEKNPQGVQYSRRLRWRISNKAHEIYKKHQ